jgi:hypothetical protein
MRHKCSNYRPEESVKVIFKYWLWVIRDNNPPWCFYYKMTPKYQYYNVNSAPWYDDIPF